MNSVLMTADEVLALSPDAASIKAAKGLAKPEKWSHLGQKDTAVWGACQGSGSSPYQTQVDLSGPSFKCSCPSRKFPCKHGLALLLLRTNQQVTSSDTPPAWVNEWMQTRQKRAQKKEDKQASKIEQATDPAATAKKEAQRWKKAQAGLQELSLWLQDTVDQGLARLSQNQTWAKQTATIAAHMVDAQMPALKNRLEDLISIIDTHPQWPRMVLSQLGDLQLILDAAARWDEQILEPHLKAKLSQYLGWNMDKAEVIVQGEAVNDVWHVIGSRHIPYENLTERHTWLVSADSQRPAFILDFSYQNRGFEQSFSLGAAYQGTLHFYHHQFGLRAVTGLDWSPEPAANTKALLASHANIANAWPYTTQLLAHNPWQSLCPLWLKQGTLQQYNGVWHVVFDEHLEAKAMPLQLADEYVWRLLACLQAHQVLYWFGEWQQATFQLLSVWQHQPDDDSLSCLWMMPKEFQA
ncbi:SWIM zinc finger family protein [Vitreoscilla stercoraria]|uniref:SWIM zinc finger family protein n=1 Tax=Vitreoscilla stercoraria TaxID=61 RepID=A0ABY4EE84_VITST|nr:SWIM zinc finger family protein [Vitreoscilla stercoraria]UOO93529.1 SWIM zinc finger family protein [Vitreoscilla stercoraria]